MVKKRYTSGSGYPEHAYILIQAHNYFRRVELALERNEGVLSMGVRTDTKEEYTTIDDARDAYIKVSEKYEHSEKKTKKYMVDEFNVSHKTWSVSRDNVERLVDDCRTDVGKAPGYFNLGATSCLRPNSRFREILPYMLLMSSLAIAGGPTALLAGAAAKTVVGRFMYGSILGAGSIIGVARELNDDYFPANKSKEEMEKKYHNCSTWAFEKLTNLGNPNKLGLKDDADNGKIKEDLKAFYLDSLVHMTSLHNGGILEALKCVITLAGTHNFSLFRTEAKNQQAQEIINKCISLDRVTSNILALEGNNLIG